MENLDEEIDERIEILKIFDIQPKACLEKVINIKFINKSWEGTTKGEHNKSSCRAFGFELGDTIISYDCELVSPKIPKRYDIFAFGDIATKLIKIPRNTEVEVKVKPIFGIMIVPEFKNEKIGFVDTKEPYQALLITKIIELSNSFSENET